MTEIVVTDLGRMAYCQAWDRQERAHERVLAGGHEEIFLVEHDPVITLGRRGETAGTFKSDFAQLQRMGIEVVQSDRGGDITYHGPGQIVAYPIIKLANHAFSVGCYVHTLEKIVIGVLGELGIRGNADPSAVGVWVDDAKICAIGVRIRRGVSMHGLALNVSGALAGFSHIVPCGLEDRGVTSIERVLGKAAPSIAEVKTVLARHLVKGLSPKAGVGIRCADGRRDQAAGI